jgi:tetratricopeptide (TPR) repeat protein
MTTAVLAARKSRSGVRLATAVDGLAEHHREEFFVRHARLVNGHVARRLIDRSRENLRIDPRSALVLGRAAAAVAERLRDPHLLGQSLRAMANALSVAGDNLAAIELHEQAIAAFDRTGDEQEMARTLSAVVQPLILLSQYDRALAAAERARELFARGGDELRLARLDLNVGNVLHRQDRFAEALACYERTHARLLALGDRDGVLSALHNQAVTLTALMDFRRALAAYQAARQLAVDRGLPQAVSQADYNIAWLYYLRGDYSRAIEMLHAAAEASRRHGDGYHAALSLLDLSEIYLELNLSADAREMAEQANVQFSQLGIGYEAAKALANSAIAYGQEGKAFRAIELFGQAREQLVQEKNQVWPSLIDLYQAVLLFDEGRLFEARRLSLAALDCFEASSLGGKAALCHLLLARIALRLNSVPEAHESCQRALANIAHGETPILIYHAQLLLGHTLLRLGHAEAAYEAYQTARNALETLRSRLRGAELKIAFVSNKVEVYERLIDLSLQRDGGQGGAEEAFGYIEQAKSRTLFDLMFQPVHALGHDEGSESSLARSVRDLREELNWYYHLVEQEQLRPGEASTERLTRFQREIGTREKEMARAIRELGISEGQQLELYQPGVRSIDDIRAALPENGVLLEYFQVDDRVLLTCLDRRGIEVVPICVMSSVANEVRMLQFHFSKFRLGPDYVRNFGASLLGATRAHLQRLFEELLAPVWSRVQGRHLVIVPHGLLHYVPFHALFDGRQYVTDVCPVSYAPSASIYARCDERPTRGAGAALVLGVPDAQAPFIEQEARAVAGALPDAHLFLGPDATEEVLRRRAQESAIVHIASHGYFRADNPMFSGIRLGDTYLNVYDLYRLRLDADLVTLSGCATGANVAAAGDELLGITRGLFCAGATTLLLSLWNVHDESTGAFMKAFYDRIADGTTPMDALRKTMADLRQEYPHPYFWAPFVLTGKCRRS